MPAGMSFVQLEGNYVISFRSMSDCLPAFTAVKLDRRRGSWDGGARRCSLTGSLGDGSSPGGGSLGGSRAALGGEEPVRRRSAALFAPYKLVLTGVPRGVRVDAVRACLEPVLGGIDRVYRDPDMARNLSHPPVFLETRSALAQEAFMLRAEWVPVVQRLVQEAGAQGASEDEGLGLSYSASSALATSPSLDEDDAEEERRRRLSLVDTLVACVHGRYHGHATCPLCRAGGRRNTMLGDDIVSHNLLGEDAPLPAASEASSAARRPAPPPAKKASSCVSCIACFRRFIPGKRKPRAAEDEDEDAVDGQQQTTTAASTAATPPGKNGLLLDPYVLSAIKSQRRMSAYGDVPAITVDAADFK